MDSEKFQVDDLVWAKMKGYPLWPAQIANPSPDNKPPKNKKAYFVFFFGSKNFAWIAEECITPHSEDMLKNLSKKKSAAYKSAIKALIKVCGNSSQTAEDSSEEDMSRYDDSNDFSQPEMVKVSNTSTKGSKKKMSTKKDKREVVRKRSLDTESSDESGVARKYIGLSAGYFPLVGSTLSSLCNSDLSSLVGISSSSFCSDSSFYTTDSSKKSVQYNEDLLPSKKIGFIGLGNMGSNIVRNLLKYGCVITVWNKTVSKCDAFIECGATKAESPSELVMSCDITFCCVSDADASKSLLFGKSGILTGLEMALQLGLPNKGFVEMTSLDPETSQEIFEAIERKGGKYLEAPLCGTSEDAMNGNLQILAAGDRDLFMDCEKYFQAMGKRAHFISCEVGYGNKMSLLQSSVSSVVYAVLAETLTMAKLMNMDETEFLEVLAKGPLQFDKLVEKAERMTKCNFETVTPLKYAQKCLDLSLKMGNKLSQPLPVTTAANELYKHARLLQYSDSDVSAIYQGVRY